MDAKMKKNGPKESRKKLETSQKTPAKQTLKSKNGRRYSRVAEVHEKNKIAAAKLMSPTDRLKRALEFSDFIRKLQALPKRGKLRHSRGF